MGAAACQIWTIMIKKKAALAERLFEDIKVLQKCIEDDMKEEKKVRP